MDTCIICHNAYDPIWDEDGKLLLDIETGICYKCKRKIELGEINLEDNTFEESEEEWN